LKGGIEPFAIQRCVENTANLLPGWNALVLVRKIRLWASYSGTKRGALAVHINLTIFCVGRNAGERCHLVQPECLRLINLQRVTQEAVVKEIIASGICHKDT
jgi:hypothetical protein